MILPLSRLSTNSKNSSKVKTLSILFIYILAFAHILYGQKSVYHFHLVEELTSNTYNSYLKKDSKGFVWISSMDGLNCFDGQNTLQFRPLSDDKQKLASGYIHSDLFEDKKGNIWFAVPNYIQKYDRKTASFQRFDLDKKGIYYAILFLDKETGELWVRDDKALYIVNLEDPSNYRALEKIEMGISASVDKFKNTTYLVVPQREETLIKLYENKKFILERHLSAEEIGKASCTLIEDNDNIWFGTTKGLVHYKFSTEQIAIVSLPFEGKEVKDIAQIVPFDEHTLILLAKKQGIFFFDKRTQSITAEIHHRKDTELKSFAIKTQNIYLDADKTLWVAVEGKGVYFTNLINTKFDLALAEKNLGLIDYISEDQHGDIWIATEGTIYIKNKANQTTTHIKHEGGGRIFSILHDADTTWISDATNGLFFVEHEKVKNNTKGSSTNTRYTNHAYDMLRLSDGTILVSTIEGPRILSTDDGLKPFKALGKNSTLYTFKIEDSEGRIYGFLPEKHLLVLQEKGSEWERDTVPFLPNVNDVIQDQTGDKLWLATNIGLYELAAGKIVTKHAALSNFSAKSILQDPNGNLWISSNAGLWKYNPSTKEYWQFNEADGLQSMNFQFQCALEASDGKFLFGGTKGCNIFDPLKIELLDKSVFPIITSILVNGTDSLTKEEHQGIANVSELEYIEVEKGRNTLTFGFASLDYSDPSNTKFEYQLEGVDNNFVQTTSNFARYPNLPHGEYKFVLKAYNSDNMLSPYSTQLRVTVTPYWYETNIFKGFLALLGLFILYQLYQTRLARVKKQEEEKRRAEKMKRLVAETKQAEKKQAQAEEQRTKAKTKLDILRLQMQPHFIFNALVSINNYIAKDPKTAQNFTLQFSKVMRKVLNLSDESYNYIADEVDLLKQYMEVENIRLDNQLSYQFEYEETLDDAMLPSMLLQPFIENAILHGIKPKDGPGQITIRFKQLGEQLLCEVEDNGVGYSTKKQADHESKAMTITQQRLDLLEEEFNIKTDLTILNLQDENPNTTGVKARILLPFIE